MPGPVIANPIPFKYRPGTESVLDDFWTRVLRRIGTITGANDPQQIMSVAGAMGIPGGEASPAEKAVQAGAQYLESKFPKLASYIKAYHGSPHDFDKFSLDKIGTGEGAQAYGHGLYFAENPATAEQYKKDLGKVVKAFNGDPTKTPAEDMAHDILSRIPRSANEQANLQRAIRTVDEWQEAGVFRGKNEAQAALDVKRAIGENYGKKLDTALQAKTYEVSINAHPDAFLDWDKPLSQQSEPVKRGVTDALKKMNLPVDEQGVPSWIQRDPDGQSIHAALSSAGASNKEGQAIGTERLKQAGIPGIKYLDQGSRGTKSIVVGLTRKSDGALVAEKAFTSQPEAAAYAQEMAAKGMETSIKDTGTRNFVVFDDSLIDIMRKYGVVLPLGAGLAALSQQGQTTGAAK